MRFDHNPENSMIELAKATDPTDWLLSKGFSVSSSSGGRELALWLGEPLRGKSADFRISRKPSRYHAGWDVFLSCFKDGSPVGRGSTNIDLGMELFPGWDAMEIAREICGAAGASLRGFEAGRKGVFGGLGRRPLPAVFPPRGGAFPAVPPEANREGGRRYLSEERGISMETILSAESQGAILYLEDGVLFLGRDSGGKIRSATKRAVFPDAEPQKRDLAGSQKCFPPVLYFQKKFGSVWIVEGFVDALAVMDIAGRLASRKKLATGPCVIASGGCRSKSWIQNPEVQKILKAAPVGHIFISLENDPPEKETALHIAKQAEEIRERTGVEARIVPAPGGFKDLAEFNLAARKNPKNFGY